jgi:hypothetical protein
MKKVVFIPMIIRVQELIFIDFFSENSEFIYSKSDMYVKNETAQRFSCFIFNILLFKLMSKKSMIYSLKYQKNVLDLQTLKNRDLKQYNLIIEIVCQLFNN